MYVEVIQLYRLYAHPHPRLIHYWPFRGGTFSVVLFVKCCVVFHFLQCFTFNNYELNYKFATILGKKLPALLAICSFCGWLIVFDCLYLWCWGLDVDLTVSVPEFTYSFCFKWPEFYCFVSAACRNLALRLHVQNAKNGFIKFEKISHIQYEGPAKSFVTGFGLLQCYVL